MRTRLSDALAEWFVGTSKVIGLTLCVAQTALVTQGALTRQICGIEPILRMPSEGLEFSFRQYLRRQIAA